MAYLLLHKLMSPSFCSFLFSFMVLFGALCEAQSVPAMYVFGDSLVDVGNNNYLTLSTIKADFPHNGVDFPGKKATGRFCNGRNAADFLSEKMGMTSAPAYLSEPNSVFMKGVNFASGGAGILNATDEGFIKRVIPLARQVGYFSAVRERLVKAMEPTAIDEHFKRSLFPIVIGSNDIINYFNAGSDLRTQNTPQQYVTLMVATLKGHLKGIYGLGARKFVLVGLSPIGCAPKQRHENASNECNTEVNYWAKKYNEELTGMLTQLQSELKDFHYSYFDTYAVFTDFINNPSTYGFSEVKAACCGNGRLRAKLPCTPLALYCSDRSTHLFWDIYHPTEAAARMFITKLFDGSGNYVSPMSVQQLIDL